MPLTLCGVEVSVHSGIRELVPLGDSTNAASDAATAFVASSLGQAFAIRVNNRTDKYLKVVLSVDGDGIGKYHLAPRKYGFHDAVAISAKIKAPMIFADYQVVSDYDPAAAKDTRELGTICVVVYEFKPEVRDNAKNMKLKTGWYDKKFTDYAYVPESSKKMGGHRMQIDLSGARKNTMRPSRWKAVNLKGRPPLCSFKFVYQPAAMLAGKGILRPGVVTRRVSLESRNGLSGWLGWFIQQF